MLSLRVELKTSSLFCTVAFPCQVRPCVIHDMELERKESKITHFRKLVKKTIIMSGSRSLGGCNYAGEGKKEVKNNDQILPTDTVDV